MFHGHRVSVILPAHNEAESIFAAVKDFQSVDVVDEVLVVNNRSTDATEAEAVRAGARVVREEVPGYGSALTCGLRQAAGDFLVLAEPDHTFVAADVHKLLAYAEEFDMVCGTRTAPSLIWAGANMGWAMRWGNTVVAKLIEFLYGGPALTDCGCTLRLITRDAWRAIDPYITVTGSHFLPEMVILALRSGMRIVEIPINYRNRVGESKITGSWKGTIRTGTNMVLLALGYLAFRPAVGAPPRRRAGQS